MTLQRPPEGSPLSQKEWDRLSDASRRWLLEAAAAAATEEAKNRDGAQPDVVESDATDDEGRAEP
jgi:TRAP-type C4-dicarboxylate transport system substrate-binding protein